MSTELPDFHNESEKTDEQYFEEIVGQAPIDFIVTIVDQMQRFKNKKNFILNEALHLLPKKEEVNEDMEKFTIILREAIDIYLEDN